MSNHNTILTKTIESYEDLLLMYEEHSNVILRIDINSDQRVSNISFNNLKIKSCRINNGTHELILKYLPVGIKWSQVKLIELCCDTN